ncbi:peptidylprolyl isomerase [Ancylobacter pratisalsi]|uniref:Peptidylprolyl isomerase n=2 Tax=Ancylobacter pratisalsi TaxID=1745854 RepID=A0A6P1YRL2_9HYPH|nr:peptidylprolyl isomerase [Ancylobacter pratisalsi]
MARKLSGRRTGGGFRALRFAPALIAGLLVVAGVSALPSPVQAQQILVMVQGQPITSFDVTQWIRLMKLTERRNLSQKQALDELIDQRLKIFTAERYGIKADREEVDKMFASMASRNGRSAEQLTSGLAQQGLSANSLKTKMQADYVWNSYVRGRFSSVATIRDSDVFAAMEDQGEDLTKAQRTTEYTVRQIVLVVSRTAPASQRSQRLAEANALRKSFTDCESGVAAARSMRETVVREPVIRTSADMSAPVRKIMNDIPIGQTTAPEVTQAGIELIAVCGRREIVGESVRKKEVRNELQSKQMDTLSKRLLEEARKAAMIQYR